MHLVCTYGIHTQADLRVSFQSLGKRVAPLRQRISFGCTEIISPVPDRAPNPSRVESRFNCNALDEDVRWADAKEELGGRRCRQRKERTRGEREGFGARYSLLAEKIRRFLLLCSSAMHDATCGVRLIRAFHASRLLNGITSRRS